jgi:hypothetical protein
VLLLERRKQSTYVRELHAGSQLIKVYEDGYVDQEWLHDSHLVLTCCHSGRKRICRVRHGVALQLQRSFEVPTLQRRKNRVHDSPSSRVSQCAFGSLSSRCFTPACLSRIRHVLWQKTGATANEAGARGRRSVALGYAVMNSIPAVQSCGASQGLHRSQNSMKLLQRQLHSRLARPAVYTQQLRCVPKVPHCWFGDTSPSATLRGTVCS